MPLSNSVYLRSVARALILCAACVSAAAAQAEEPTPPTPAAPTSAPAPVVDVRGVISPQDAAILNALIFEESEKTGAATLPSDTDSPAVPRAKSAPVASMSVAHALPKEAPTSDSVPSSTVSKPKKPQLSVGQFTMRKPVSVGAALINLCLASKLLDAGVAQSFEGYITSELKGCAELKLGEIVSVRDYAGANAQLETQLDGSGRPNVSYAFTNRMVVERKVGPVTPSLSWTYAIDGGLNGGGSSDGVNRISFAVTAAP